MNNMTTALLSLLTGMILGAIFALFKLPIPAPATIAGILGILGIYLGFKIVSFFL